MSTLQYVWRCHFWCCLIAALLLYWLVYRSCYFGYSVLFSVCFSFRFLLALVYIGQTFWVLVEIEDGIWFPLHYAMWNSCSKSGCVQRYYIVNRLKLWQISRNSFDKGWSLRLSLLYLIISSCLTKIKVLAQSCLLVNFKRKGKKRASNYTL